MTKSNRPARPVMNSRRVFMRNVGLAAGAATLLPVAASLAQIPDPDPNENCFPPIPSPGTSLPNPTPFKPDTRPVRERKSVWDLSATELTRLKAAYQKLRALPADDPRSWLAQAHIHCWYCSGSADGPSSIEIHGGWNFFPWHRAYLYFHERILAHLVGDDTFFLPFWDWDNPLRTTIPAPYADPTSSLYDSVRGATTTSTPTLATTLSENGVDIPASMQDADWELFMGTRPDSFNNYGGGIENGPHGLTHLWVGQPSLENQNGIADMGVLQTAARDPIFFAHHCNIDKLWSVWSAADPSHKNPDDCAWTSGQWNFFDENQIWTSISVADMNDPESSLGVYYPGTRKTQVQAKRMALEAAPQTTTQGSDPTTRQISAPPVLRAPSPMAESASLRAVHVLHIDGINVPANERAVVRVFVNMPTATAQTSAKSPNFVGTFVVLPKTLKLGSGHDHRKTNVAFDITRKIGTVIKSADKVSVTLVPVTGPHKKPDVIHMTYDKVYISTK